MGKSTYKTPIEKRVYDISYYHIRPEDHQFFRIFDPLDRLDLAILPGSLVVGAFRMADSDPEPEPAGLLIASDEGDRYTIEWLAVAPFYRGKEVGSELLDILFRASERRGYDILSARFTYELGIPEKAYFTLGFFEQSESERSIYRVSLGKLLGSATLPLPAREKCVISLGEFHDHGKIMEYIQEACLCYKLSNGILPPWDADPKLSCLWLEEGKICGVFLILSCADRHYPALIAADSDYEADACIAFSADQADELGLHEDTLILPFKSQSIAFRMRKYIGTEDSFRREILTADVREYLSYQTVNTPSERRD